MTSHAVWRLGLSFVAIFCLGSSDAIASGTYMGRPSRPSASIDRSSYELGKKVFAGEIGTAARASREAPQAEVLGQLQTRLPQRVRARVDLTAYAGRLDPEEMDALQYYLERRYKVKIDD